MEVDWLKHTAKSSYGLRTSINSMYKNHLYTLEISIYDNYISSQKFTYDHREN